MNAEGQPVLDIFDGSFPERDVDEAHVSYGGPDVREAGEKNFFREEGFRENHGDRLGGLLRRKGGGMHPPRRRPFPERPQVLSEGHPN